MPLFRSVNAKLEFMERELAWVQLHRKTKRPSELHLVVPAVEREQEIIAGIAKLRAEAEPQLELAAQPASTGTDGH